ncbi:MAG: lysine--tRNA ligase [Chloroflexi bacterium]|nr:lysine--tRNA ligase [Chloroflexota bacterium]
MSQEDNELIKNRIEKLKNLISMDIDPYPSNYKRTHTSKEAIDYFEKNESKDLEVEEISIAGRIMSIRDMGKAIFIDLLDGDGRIQVLCRANTLEEQFKNIPNLDLGDWLGVKGKLFRTRTGQITVLANNYDILCKSIRPLPEKWHGLTDIELRFRQRYLDLISNEQSKNTALNRSKIIKAIRNFMDNKGFIEVETPVLVPVAAGASAHPFITHHNQLNQQLYLRVATELYLKKLIVGGLEKVYEIGRVFRNEGVDFYHNPEFTMLESYQAFADYNDMMIMVEEMISSVADEIYGTKVLEFNGTKIDFTPPWPRLDLRETIKEYSGIDYIENLDIDSLSKEMKRLGIDVDKQVSWGGMMDKLISSKVEPNLIQPSFLVDYPISMSPLAKKKTSDPRVVERFEGFIAGMEICNSFTELNDPIDQRERFEQQEDLRDKFEKEEMDRLDEDFLVAIEHGMPPTGGIGIGLDRITMLLCNQKTIREVILFPHLRNLKTSENEN